MQMLVKRSSTTIETRSISLRVLNSFESERWNLEDHPQLISWGFDSRSCPASRIGYNLSKKMIQKVLLNENIWILPASNFKHNRTFLEGCQVWIGEGMKPPSLKWKFKGQWTNQFHQWIFSRLRMLDQGELW